MRIIKVLIASPSDVGEERKIAEEVIRDWNVRHDGKEEIVLEAVLWESHTAPDSSDRTQGIINKKIVDKCHCAIGIFWTRCGTDTGVAPGGAVEEVERMMGKGKHVMLYFSDIPAIRKKIDKDQETKLDAFKEKIRPKALTYDFPDREDFRYKLSHHLELQIREWFIDPTTQPTALPKPDNAADLQCY